MAQARSQEPGGVAHLLRDVRFLQIAGQFIFILLLVIALFFLAQNVYTALAKINKIPNFDFLDDRAGFLPSAQDASFGDAFVIGLLNTVSVTVVGLILSTLLGIFVGICLLSTNWLVRNISQGYVEIMRNTPLLVQLYAWYNIGILSLPNINNAITIPPYLVFSNRGIYIANILPTPRGVVMGLLILIGIAVAAFFWIRAGQIAVNTGRRLPRSRYVVLILIGFFLTGVVLSSSITVPDTVTVDRDGQSVTLPVSEALSEGLITIEESAQYSTAPVVVAPPERRGLRYVGGTEYSPEYIALVLALVIYTAAFIAEIVRAGIQSVDKGQREASRALGLTYSQTLSMIILPQALRVIIPPLGNQYLNLAKNSSLAIAISFIDMFQISFTIINQTGQTVSMFALVMTMYLIISLTIALVMNILNRRFQLVRR